MYTEYYTGVSGCGAMDICMECGAFSHNEMHASLNIYHSLRAVAHCGGHDIAHLKKFEKAQIVHLFQIFNYLFILID